MSRQFAIWVTQAGHWTPRPTGHWLRGCVLGRAPEPTDALTILSPLSRPLRTHCLGLVGLPRGNESAGPALVIEPVPGLSPSRLVGGLIVEEGVRCRFFAARLREPRAPVLSVARLVIGDRDRAWGIISLQGLAMNGVVVGGGLGQRQIWDHLLRIELENGESIEPDALLPIRSRMDAWLLRTIAEYSRSRTEALVVRSVGPATVDYAQLSLDDNPRSADVHQQDDGVTQFFLDKTGGPPPSTFIVESPRLVA